MEEDPRRWTKSDLDELIKAERAESLTLDYKKSGALSKNPEARAELAKDVSALANSAGGTLIYGMTEANRIATGFDGGVDPREISVEWIQNTVYGNVEPRVDGVDVHQYPLGGQVGYIAHVPQGRTAHMYVPEKRYYKRLEGLNVAMADYEIRDAMRRGDVPHVELRLRNHPTDSREVFVEIRNVSNAPALYFTFSLLLGPGVNLPRAGGRVGSGWAKDGGRVRSVVVDGSTWDFAEWRYEWWDEMPLFKTDWQELGMYELTLAPAATVLWIAEGPGMQTTGAYRVPNDIVPYRLKPAPDVSWSLAPRE